MKPIGTPPPRNPTFSEAKKAILAGEYNQQHKTTMPKAAYNDQMGATPEQAEPGMLDCSNCGEQYEFGKAWMWDGDRGCLCEHCFRVMALEKYAVG